MIKIDIDKAKDISHELRRNKRAELFAPLDTQVTIPGMSEAAEAKRQLIRDEFDVFQERIDQVEDPEQLKEIVLEIQSKQIE